LHPRITDEILFGAKLFRTPSIGKRGYPCFKYIEKQVYLRQRAINKQAIPISVLHSLIDHPYNRYSVTLNISQFE